MRKIFFSLFKLRRLRKTISQNNGEKSFLLFMKELEDTSPTNEAEGQNTASASRTKLLENRRDSETSTARESGTDVE